MTKKEKATPTVAAADASARSDAGAAASKPAVRRRGVARAKPDGASAVKTSPGPSKPRSPAPTRTRAAATAAPAAAVEPKPEKARKSKPKKVKTVRDSFSMPDYDYRRIADLKVKCLAEGVHVKKSELLRAGLIALGDLDGRGLRALLERVEKIKTGRPVG